MAARVVLRVLGPMELTVDGVPVSIGGPQRRTLLALLLLNQGSVVPADRIIDAIWGEDPPRTALIKVQGHVCALRKALVGAGYRTGRNLLCTQPPGYRLDPEHLESDLKDFIAMSTRAAALDRLGRSMEASALYDTALRGWRGPAFAGSAGDEIRNHAVRVDELRLLALEDLAVAELRLGRFRAVLTRLGPVVDSEPLRERCRELLIQAMLGLGQRHAALRCYETGRLLLRRELGISPGHGLRRLADSIRGSDLATR